MTGSHIIIVALALLHLEKGENLIENDSEKFNVVLFLAKTSISDRYLQDSGIKFLNFVEKSRVKHCASESSTGEEPNSYSASSDCKQLLKTGIYALISYCRNVVGMATAIACIENDTFSNGLRFKKSASEDLEIRYHYPRRMGLHYGNSPELVMRNKPRFITKPEHTEVFKIRAKRQDLPQDVVPQITDENGNKWDIFGIMANIKLTFFGKFFEKNENMEKLMPQNGLINQLGKVSENSLFELVKETLLNVQDNHESGFLMIILGGDLKEISDIYSNLMQSVKHVVENTDERNTLIVVTGSCPIIDRAESSEIEHYSIPVYDKAPPKTGGITISGQLYDVPYAIKNLLAEMNGGNYFSGVRTKRDTSAKTKERRSNTGNYPSLLPIFLSCYILTLIL